MKVTNSFTHYKGYWVSYKGYVIGKRGKLRIGINPRTKRPQIHIHHKTTPLHRFVALAWLPNPDNKPCVCHKDNNPLNNRVSNLYWGTYKENTQQCIKDGRLKPRGKPMINQDTIHHIIIDYNNRMSRSELKNKYSLSDSRITSLIRTYSQPRYGNHKNDSLDKVQIVKEYKISGLTPQNFCKEFRYNICKTTLRNWCKKYGKNY